MNKVISYLQTDSKWADIDYSAKGEKTTIGKSGCGPTSMAMVAATWADKNITPKEACAWALENGFKAVNQGTYYSYFAAAGKHYGLTTRQLNGTSVYGKTSDYAKDINKKAVEAIVGGNIVIAAMGKGLWTSSGHFVVLYDVKDGTAYINDPNSTKEGRIKSELSLFQSQVKYYFIVEKSGIINNHTANYYAVQKKYSFDNATMLYLEAYKYADSLFAIMLQDVSTQKYQLSTVNYILQYKYGVELFSKLMK